MTTFFRFPHTPHLAWLGAGQPRDDKVLAPEEARQLLSGEVVVEEKVDGANLGISIDESGTLRAQNRGKYLDLTGLRDQWKPLKRWLSLHQEQLRSTLGPELILFGEWCYAVHSVRYTRLPDWFLAFDIYDRNAETFWTVERRNALSTQLGLATVPQCARGHVDLPALHALMERSELTDAPAEGLYIRREGPGQLLARAKLVRAAFTQAIDEHWSKRRLEANQLAAGPKPNP